MVFMSSSKSDILLVNPPYGPLDGPYISIPTLSSYLRKNGVKVSGFDANVKSYFELFKTGTLIGKKNHMKKRFIELNEKKELDFSEMNEFMILYMMIFEMNILRDKLDFLMKDGMSHGNIRKSRIADSLIDFFSIENFPEIVLSKPVFTVYSDFSFFSSKQVLESIYRENVYTRIFDRIVDTMLGNFSGNIPGIIGFSVVFSNQLMPAFRMAHYIKKNHPEIHVTMGGPFVSLYMNETDNRDIFNVVDSLITGEGEKPLCALSRELSLDNPDFDKVPGMIRLSEGRIVRNAEATVLEMHESPPPDYNIFDLEDYLYDKSDMWLSFRLSKGCTWGKCAFCRTELYFENCRKKPSKEFIYDQLKEVILSTGIKNINFSDESFDPELLEYISNQLLSDGIGINWKAHTRIDRQMTHERCLLFKKSGCVQISLGIESFSDRVLKIMKKGITTGLIDDVLNQINGVIPVNLYMMMGFPGETKDEAENGFQKISDYKDKGLVEHYYYSYFSIVYGSDIFVNPSKYGIRSVFIPPEEDLHPDITFFDCEGMTKDDAYRLHEKFMRPYFQGIFKKYEDVMEYVNGKMNYDVDVIREIIFSQNGGLYLPFIKWMKNCRIKAVPKQALIQ
jgi:radical SAM superfamily enzyme YgiQ (UPF0313 family)